MLGRDGCPARAGALSAGLIVLGKESVNLVTMGFPVCDGNLDLASIQSRMIAKEARYVPLVSPVESNDLPHVKASPCQVCPSSLRAVNERDAGMPAHSETFLHKPGQHLADGPSLLACKSAQLAFVLFRNPSADWFALPCRRHGFPPTR